MPPESYNAMLLALMSPLPIDMPAAAMAPVPSFSVGENIIGDVSERLTKRPLASTSHLPINPVFALIKPVMSALTAVRNPVLVALKLVVVPSLSTISIPVREPTVIFPASRFSTITSDASIVPAVILLALMLARASLPSVKATHAPATLLCSLLPLPESNQMSPSLPVVGCVLPRNTAFFPFALANATLPSEVAVLISATTSGASVSLVTDPS